MAEAEDRRRTQSEVRAEVGVISRERIDKVDGEFKSLSERADEIYTVFQLAATELEMDFRQIDLVYFCAQYLGQMVVSGFGDEVFQNSVKLINRFLNFYHYTFAEKLYGEEGGGAVTDPGAGRFGDST